LNYHSQNFELCSLSASSGIDVTHLKVMDKKQSGGIALCKVGFDKMFVMIILDLQFVALILPVQVFPWFAFWQLAHTDITFQGTK
jgi:hypothetical protein